MEFVEPEDDPGSYRSPLPPEDRLWRHPSEIGPPPPHRRSRRSVWMVAGVSALGAALLSTGLVVLAGTLLVGPGSVPVQEVVARPVPTAVDGDDVVRITERARPAIAWLSSDRGGGSGVVFRSDGHLLANAHVVDGSSSVTVVLGDGRELPGRVVGVDHDTDIAVVKVDGGALPIVTMGTAAHLEVGQKAIAVGSPLGPAGGPAVSVGVVSALHRTVRARTGARPMHDMVQTDVSVAAGASGGALLDANGTVIGITTAMAASDGGTGDPGFAVPIDVARSVADHLMTSGRVVNAWIGIQCQDLDSAAATELDVEAGAMVADVRSDSPAERGGVAVGDVIVAVDGKAIATMGQLVVAVRLHQPGSVVVLDVVRDRQRRTMPVTLAERPPNA